MKYTQKNIELELLSYLSLSVASQNHIILVVRNWLEFACRMAIDL